MANATTSIVRMEEDVAGKAQAQIQQATVENAEAIVEALGLLQDLEERGVIPLLRALVEQGDDVLKVILALVSRDEVAGGLKNLISVFQMFTAIEPGAMEKLFSGVENGVKEAVQVTDAKMGIYDMLKAFRDPDVSRAIAFALSFLKGMGRSMAPSEASAGGSSQ